MDGNPWGSAWSEPEKELVQEVTLKPKADTWLTSPASGDLGVAWSSSTQWDTRTDPQAAWKPEPTRFGSGNTPWGSAFETRAADVLGGSENSHSLQSTPLKDVFSDHNGITSTYEQSKDLNAFEESNAEPLPALDELPTEEDKPIFAAPFEVQEDESADTWRTLENAAVTVGNDAAWETAWKPDLDEEDAQAQSHTRTSDDWAEAVQQRQIRDAKVPPEVLERIFTHYKELEKNLWPDEDLETAREGPAPRAEWQGGLENVEGLTALVNRYLPPNISAPPIHFDTTKIAASLQNAMKLTKSYGMIQKSPLSRLIRTSESWEQSARSGGNTTPFSLESWLSTRGSSALSMSSPYVSGSGVADTESQRKAASLMSRFARSSVDRGRASSSGTPTPRVSQDGMPSIMSIAATNGSTTPLSPTHMSFSTESPAQTTAPSAVARFLNRFSRRAEDAPKRSTTVNLRPDELDFLDMMPAINPNGQVAESIQKEMESLGSHPGQQALGFGSSIIATPTPSRQGMLDSRPVEKLTSTANIGQITSKDFDILLDAQILEVEDEMMRESLIAASIIAGPTDSRYVNMHVPLFGSKPPNGAQLLSNSGPTRSNTLLDDDDDFDPFLSSSTPPSKARVHMRTPSQPSIIPSAFVQSPPSLPAQNTSTTFMRNVSPPNARSGSTKVSPTASRAPTIAIMSQNTGSRASTPASMTIAPLLPPPPGGRQLRSPPIQSQGDLLNDSMSSSSQTQSPAGSKRPTNATQMETLFGLSTRMVSVVPNSMPVVAPKSTAPSTTPAAAGVLSAQDLSFFEGL